MALTYERMSIFTSAKHKGSIVLMIDQHDGHVLLRQKAHQIAGGKNSKDKSQLAST
jgi:hypothetical protein